MSDAAQTRDAPFLERPSYERSLPYLLQLQADVLTLECASNHGRDLPLLSTTRLKRRSPLGLSTIEPPHLIADLIRKALEYVPPERVVITVDCGFGREGLSRRIAFYKCVALVQETNIVRKELGLLGVYIRGSRPQLCLPIGLR
jgi:5-methyltetrahydropteroyltriglutamate--homocysteine methyltransferase